MIHPSQGDLTLVSKAELQQEEEIHPSLSVVLMAELNSFLLASPLQSITGFKEGYKYNLPKTHEHWQ